MPKRALKSGAGKPKTSKYRGVSFQKSTDLWIASISIGGKCFAEQCKTEEAAAHEYDRMAIRWLRSKAKTNFPITEYEIPEPPPVIGLDGVVTSEHMRSACHRYVMMQSLVGRNRTENWVVVNNLFFWDRKDVSKEWIQEWCEKMGINPLGDDL